MISSKELIEEVRQQGYKLELRTLREYVNRGLLPKPIAQKRQQEKGQGGGMIAFYPDKTKNALVAILKSRNEGIGLEEIKKKLYDHEAWEFFQYLSMIQKKLNVDIMQDFGLWEIMEDEQTLSPFGAVFFKYLYDERVPTDFIKTKSNAKSEIFIQALIEGLKKIRLLFTTIYGWDAREKLRYLANFAIEHLRSSWMIQFQALLTLETLYGKLDERSKKTKVGILIHSEGEELKQALVIRDAGIRKLKKLLENF